MLVLTRKLMEKLYIGDDICVTVVRLEGGQVRLGIDAPRDVSVVRAELVPERLMGSSRGGHGHVPAPRAGEPGTETGPVAPPCSSTPHTEGNVRIPPVATTRGNDSRRRGRSR